MCHLHIYIYIYITLYILKIWELRGSTCLKQGKFFILHCGAKVVFGEAILFEPKTVTWSELEANVGGQEGTSASFVSQFHTSKWCLLCRKTLTRDHLNLICFTVSHIQATSHAVRGTCGICSQTAKCGAQSSMPLHDSQNPQTMQKENQARQSKRNKANKQPNKQTSIQRSRVHVLSLEMHVTDGHACAIF